MDRRRTDRRRQMEMVLASIFLARSVSQNTWNCRTQDSTYPANNVNNLEFVNGRKVPEGALIGSESCANPVNRIPVSRTKEIISGHELFLALLWQAVKRATGGVLAYLEKAELKAANRGERWEADDYRLSQHVVLLAEEGKADPYTLGFFRQYHIHPSKVTWWWRDSKKLLFLAEATNCPTPLLVANRAEEAFNSPALIPDYDPTLQVSPVLPSSSFALNPANTPAPVRTTGAGDKEIL